MIETLKRVRRMFIFPHQRFRRVVHRVSSGTGPKVSYVGDVKEESCEFSRNVCQEKKERLKKRGEMPCRKKYKREREDKFYRVFETKSVEKERQPFFV